MGPRTLARVWSALTTWPSRLHGRQLRWPNTVSARALADAIQHVHKNYKNKYAIDKAIIFLCSMSALSLLFFLGIERSVLLASVFYNKGMSEKVTMQRT